MKNNQKQDRFLFSDYHVSKINTKNNVNTQQRKDFIDIAKQLNAAVIVEDAYVYNSSELNKNFVEYNNNDYTFLPLNIAYLNQDKSILNGLSALCHYANIPVTNVEFRFCFHAEANIQKLYDLYNFVRQEIENYEDGPLLNEIYTNELMLCDQEFNKAMNALKQFLSNPPAQTFFSRIITALNLIPNQLDIHLLQVGVALNSLLDVRILHLLENEYKDNQTVFIAAGGLHIYNLVNHLLKLGYTIEQNYGHDFWLEPPAINIREPFKKFGIKFQPQKTSLVTGILATKNFFEQNKLHYIFDTRFLTGSLPGLVSIKVHPKTYKNPAAFLLWFIIPSPVFAFNSFIDYLLDKPVKRK